MKIKIHMKSGKTLTQSGVKDYRIEYTDSAIIAISIDLHWFQSRTIIIASLDLDSIEAMTKH